MRYLVNLLNLGAKVQKNIEFCKFICIIEKKIVILQRNWKRMRDFTLRIYRELLLSLKNAGYQMVTFSQYCEGVTGKFVVLRHDVDLRAGNSLETAKIEAELGMKASYYFRVVKESNQPEKIRAIAALGHEIGYHYEDMSMCGGDVDKAIAHFRKWLSYFRTYYPVKTICMHGAPTSKFDGKDLWKKYDYREEGIVGEPYFDADFSKMLYLTDTGRCWDGYKVSVRDKIEGHQDRWNKEKLCFHRTEDIIGALKDESSPLRKSGTPIMITTHPQRWTDNVELWWKELVMQSAKNVVKRLLICLRG